MIHTAYVGIDVAFAKGKLLPVSVCTITDGKLTPLPLRYGPRPSRGRGNVAALDENQVAAFASETRAFLAAVEEQHHIRIARIAIDAPMDYRRENMPRRAGDAAMDKLGISCFTTPSRSDFWAIRAKAKAHLDAGRPVSRLPHSNQLWMLAGFALFRELGKTYDCIEVYPQAIARTLGCSGRHKSKQEGLKEQLGAVASATGWGAQELRQAISMQGYGSAHDKLDAFMAAWVASLPRDSIVACGCPPDDVIWIPLVPSALMDERQPDRLFPVLQA